MPETRGPDQFRSSAKPEVNLRLGSVDTQQQLSDAYTVPTGTNNAQHITDIACLGNDILVSIEALQIPTSRRRGRKKSRID